MLFRVQIFHKGGSDEYTGITVPFEQATIRLEVNSASINYTFSPRPELMLLPPGTRFVFQYLDDVDGEWKAGVDSYLVGTPFRMSPDLYVSVETVSPLNWALNSQARFAALFLTAGASRLPSLAPEFELYGQEPPTDIDDPETHPSLVSLLNDASTSTSFGSVQVNRSNDSSAVATIVKYFLDATVSGKALEARHKVLQRFWVTPSAGKWICDYGLKPRLSEMLLGGNPGGGPATLGSILGALAGQAGFSVCPQFGFKENHLGGANFLSQFMVLPTTYTTQPPLSNVIFPQDIHAFEMNQQYNTPTRLLGYMSPMLDPQGVDWPMVFAKQVSTRDPNGASSESSRRLELSALEELTGIRAYESNFPVSSIAAMDATNDDPAFYKNADPFGLVHKSRITLQDAKVSQQYSKVLTDFNPYAIVGLPGVVIVSGLPYRGEVKSIVHQIDNRSGAYTTTYMLTGLRLLPKTTNDNFEICDGFDGQLQDSKIDKIYYDSFGTVSPLGLDNFASPFWTAETRSNTKGAFTDRHSVLATLLSYISEKPEGTAKALLQRLRYRPMAGVETYISSILPQTVEDLPHCEVVDELAALLMKMLKSAEKPLITQKALNQRARAAIDALESLRSGSHSPVVDLVLGEYGVMATKLTMQAD